jgi:hypothetical protein
MVTSAEPKPVMPKISAPAKAIAASSGASGSTDQHKKKGSEQFSRNKSTRAETQYVSGKLL